MKVEFFKHNIDLEEKRLVNETLESVFLTTGPKTRQFEEDFFTTPEGKKLIRQQAKNTVVKSKIEDGENITEAQKEANKLAKNNEKQDNATKDFISGEAKKATQAKVGTRKDFGTFAYPLTLRKTDQDVIKFTILEYKPRGFKAKEGSLDFFDERNVVKDRRIAGNIVLPIPGVVTDANACEWGEDSMTALDAALANIGLEFLTGDVSGALKNTGSAIQKNLSLIHI